jgi:phosphate transport system substrate-binding protein
MRWNQINIDWPDRPLRLCAPGRDSGTYDMFNKAINGDPANARQDVVSSEDDLVLVKCVASDPNAVGYFGYSYYATNREKLKALTVVGPRGPVSPSPRTVQNETYLPLLRPLFLYVNDQVLLQYEPGRRFLNWTLRHGLRLTEKVGLIPLPASTYRLAETKLYRRVLGTAFGGELAVGEGVGQTLRRSLDSIKRPQFR